MQPKRRCSTCGEEKPGLYLHHGKLYCGRCLVADDDDDLIMKSRILVIRTQETRDQLRKRRKK